MTDSRFPEFDKWYTEKDVKPIVRNLWTSLPKHKKNQLEFYYPYQDYIQNAIGFLYDYWEYYVEDDEPSCKYRKPILGSTIRALCREFKLHKLLVKLERSSNLFHDSNKKKDIDLVSYVEIEKSYEKLLKSKEFNAFLKSRRKKLVDV